jgi:hypothetical protein
MLSALIIHPSCVPGRVGVHKKGVDKNDVPIRHRRLAYWNAVSYRMLNRKGENNTFRIGVNWQGALKHKRRKQRA